MPEPSEPKDLTRTVVRGASLSSGGLILTQVLNLAIYVVLARLASPKTFGTFAAASIFVTIGELVSDSGLTAALIHRRDRLEEALSTAFVAALVSGGLFTLLAAGLAPLAGLYFGSREIGLLTLAMSAIHLFHGAIVVPEALLARRFAFARRLVVDPSATAALGVVSAIALAEGLGPWGLLLGFYAYGFVRIVLTWAFVAWRPSLGRASFAMWRELAGYGRHVLTAAFCQQGTQAMITLLVGRFIGTAPLGQYRFGSRIATSTTAPVMSASAYVLFPAFARISTDQTRYLPAFLRALRLLCFFVIPLSFVLFAIGEPLTVLLLGDRWRTAGHVVTTLCGLGASMSLIAIASDALKSSGRPDAVARIYVLWTALTTALAAALLPLGVIEVAAGVSVSAAVAAAYAVYAAVRVIGVRRRPVLQAIWPPVVAAGATSLAVALLEHSVLHSANRPTTLGLMLLALEIVISAVGYLGIMAVLARTTMGEALHSIRLALGGANSSLARRAASDRTPLAEPDAQREPTGAP
jgi:O-antigen/teichoic acid export membrane protein